MTKPTYPVLSVMFQLATDSKEFDLFRAASSKYLIAAGVAYETSAHQALISVPGGAHPSDATIQSIVDSIIQETGSKGHGPTPPRPSEDAEASEEQTPSEDPDAPRPVPLLSAFHAKFVEGKEIAWGSRPDIAKELAAEIKGANLKW